MKFHRFVLDTNVLISAAIVPHSVPVQLLARVLSEATLLTSQYINHELPGFCSMTGNSAPD